MKRIMCLVMVLVAMMAIPVQAQIYVAAKPVSDSKASGDIAFAETLTKPTLPKVTLPTNNLMMEVKTLAFTVQDLTNLVIWVNGAVIDDATSTRHPVVSGGEVIVFFSDRFELIGAPQCHWDGTSEQTRYSYTLTMKEISPKYPSRDRLLSFSINLLDFPATYTTFEGNTQITRMGLKPQNEMVMFTAEPLEGVEASNIRAFAAKHEKE